MHMFVSFESFHYYYYELNESKAKSYCAQCTLHTHTQYRVFALEQEEEMNASPFYILECFFSSSSAHAVVSIVVIYFDYIQVIAASAVTFYFLCL